MITRKKPRVLEALIPIISLIVFLSVTILKYDGSPHVPLIFAALVAGDQYLSLVIPGRMYKDEYEKRGLHPKNLSRCLEDSGTLTSPLVPWNTCGAFMFGALGVHPFVYLPFAFLNLVNPVVSILYGYTGITMEKINEKEVGKITSQVQSA